MAEPLLETRVAGHLDRTLVPVAAGWQLEHSRDDGFQGRVRGKPVFRNRKFNNAQSR